MIKENQDNFEKPDIPDFKLLDTKKSIIDPIHRVTEKNIFDLAKNILLVSTVVFIVLLLLKIFVNESLFPGIKQTWDFSSVFLQSIISIVLGYYFGSKQKDW